MRIGKPDYYDEFRCIAGACGDSCCIGWEIDVDEDKQEMYRSVSGELGKRLRECIDWEEGHFILQGKEERCPFLNRENLCDLIIGLGDAALCEICREHPRFYDWFDDYTEVGLGLCCEAAGRLILGKKEPVGLVVEEESRPEEDPSESDYGEMYLQEEEEILFAARRLAFVMLQERKISIWERLRCFLIFVEEMQEAWDSCGLDGLEELVESVERKRMHRRWDADEPMPPQPIEYARAYAGVLRLCRKLEPIDESWSGILDLLENLVSRPEQLMELEKDMLRVSQDREYEYEQLAVYFVYRYFMKCREDGDICSKGMLTVFCILLIRLLDVAGLAGTGSLTMEDRVQNAKCCSKEIEYSEENLELLEDAFREQEDLSLEQLVLLLNPGYCKK